MHRLNIAYLRMRAAIVSTFLAVTLSSFRVTSQTLPNLFISVQTALQTLSPPLFIYLSMQVPSQTYFPFRFTERPPESQILHLRKDFQNKNKNQNYHQIELTRPWLPPRPDPNKQLKSRPSSKQRPRSTFSEAELMKKMQNLEHKLQQLLREALCMAQVLSEHQISMVFNDKTHERSRKVDDSLLQEQYNALRNKLYAIKWVPTSHKLQTYSIPSRPNHPQNLHQKPNIKTLRLQRTIDVKLPSSPKSTSKSVERTETPVMRQSDINRAHCSGTGSTQTQEFEALKKKIEHYRHKANKCENAASQLMRTNEAIHQINEQINTENVRLRCQLLNAKYGPKAY